MRRLALAIGVLFLAATVCGAEEPAANTGAQEAGAKAQAQESAAKAPAETSAFKTQKEKASYALGMAFGRNMKSQGIDLDPDVFIKAYKDILSETKPSMTDEEAQQTMTAFQMEMVAKQQEEMKKKGEEQKAKGEAYLAENKNKEGVHATASGLQYKVLKEGDGKKPAAGDTVTVNYRGTLVDGTEFDSSFKRNEPASFPVSGVIPGWTEALQLMKTGSKYEIVIPSNLAYGETGAGGVIPPNATLVFEVELISIAPAAAPKTAGKTNGQTGSKTPGTAAKQTKSK